ncbi:substrate-binding periplasmic protein [Maridesulfovibrio sp. FT414]|uniref:substrate-binding periplasmic protein n=1 Tax=Maridesulfovibrio sp. FT414 TaxID=2979469 RepID=UPI003D80A203
MHRTMLCLLIITGIFLLGDIQPEAEAGEVVKVGVAHFPPWVTAGKGGINGVDFELINVVFDRIGIHPEYVSLEFSEILDRMKTGEIDASLCLLFREDRNKYIRYISPPYRTKSTVKFYVLKKSGICVKRYIDIAGRRVAVSKGARYFPTFDLDDRMVKVEYGSQKEAFRALADGYVDVTICSGASGEYYLKELGVQDRIRSCMFTYAPKLMPVYIGVSRKSKLMHKADGMEASLRKMQEEGVIEEIAGRYGVSVR